MSSEKKLTTPTPDAPSADRRLSLNPLQERALRQSIAIQPQNQEAKAKAAAKLALQDLDPKSVRERNIFMSGNASGVLAIHFRHLHNFNKGYFKQGYDDVLNLFCLVSAGYVCKNTKKVKLKRGELGDAGKAETHGNKNSPQPGTAKTATLIYKERKALEELRKEQMKNGGNWETIESGKAIVGIDTLKNLSVNVNRRSEDEENSVFFYLVYCEKDGNYIVIGSAMITVFEFIAAMQGTKQIPLARSKVPVCELCIDFAFRYGSLGYGYGHQLEKHSNLMPQKEILKQSLFPRVDPPSFRKDPENLCKIMHVDYPEYLNLTEKSEIGSDYVRNLANQMAKSSCEAQDNLLDIKENPYYKRVARARKSVLDCLGSDDQSLCDEDYKRVYKITLGEEQRIVSKLINKRKKLPQVTRELNTKKTRYERIQFLEMLLAKRGDALSTMGKNIEDLGEHLFDAHKFQKNNEKFNMQEQMIEADVLMDMSPGVNDRSQRKKKAKPKKTSDSRTSIISNSVQTFMGRVSSFLKGPNEGTDGNSLDNDAIRMSAIGEDYDSDE